MACFEKLLVAGTGTLQTRRLGDFDRIEELFLRDVEIAVGARLHVDQPTTTLVADEQKELR